MRTTVTLDPDTEHVVRRRMREKGVSFKQALNDAIREGASERSASRHETPTFEMGVPTLDLTKALRISAELEDENLVAKLRRGA